MSKQLHTFYDKTKQVHIYLSIGLIFILFFMIAPLGLKRSTVNFGQFIIILILSYTLFCNLTETRNFDLNEQKQQNKDKDMDMKNNIMLSYLLSFVLLLLIIYVIYSTLY